MNIDFYRETVLHFLGYRLGVRKHFSSEKLSREQKILQKFLKIVFKFQHFFNCLREKIAKFFNPRNKAFKSQVYRL